MAELAYAHDSGSCGHNARAGSSPAICTRYKKRKTLCSIGFSVFLCKNDFIFCISLITGFALVKRKIFPVDRAVFVLYLVAPLKVCSNQNHCDLPLKLMNTVCHK